MSDLLESLATLIEKRHDGDGWFVFSELADKPGFYSKRFADHAALGLWSSTHYEFHLYETKVSREDVKREMRDPSKVDGVGKYAHYWWLVVSDLKIIQDVVVPDCWGILVPTVRGGSRMLTVHRKAPKRKPTAFSPMFCVALIRNMGKRWVRPSKHRELEERLYRLEHPSVPDAGRDAIETLEEERDRLQRRVGELEASIAEFEKHSGVDMAEVRAGRWRGNNIARAVKIALELQVDGGERVRRQIYALAESAQSDLSRALDHARSVRLLRELIGEAIEHERRCDKKRVLGNADRIPCTCGAELSEVEATLAEHDRIWA